MPRKKWTPKTEIDHSLLTFREKRKWQIALRRYVLEKQKCLSYAPFFGIDNQRFREWIELQFDEASNWSNFSDAWQFDHVVPVAYFNFSDEEDLRLCWNFTNIRVAQIEKTGATANRMDVLTSKRYFESLHQQTGYIVCQAMVEKINQIEEARVKNDKPLVGFITENQGYLTAAQGFTPEDFERLNTGTNLQVLLAEKEFLKKFGG